MAKNYGGGAFAQFGNNSVPMTSMEVEYGGAGNAIYGSGFKERYDRAQTEYRKRMNEAQSNYLNKMKDVSMNEANMKAPPMASGNLYSLMDNASKNTTQPTQNTNLNPSTTYEPGVFGTPPVSKPLGPGNVTQQSVNKNGVTTKSFGTTPVVPSNTPPNSPSPAIPKEYSTGGYEIKTPEYLDPRKSMVTLTDKMQINETTGPMTGPTGPTKGPMTAEQERSGSRNGGGSSTLVNGGGEPKMVDPGETIRAYGRGNDVFENKDIGKFYSGKMKSYTDRIAGMSDYLDELNRNDMKNYVDKFASIAHEDPTEMYKQYESNLPTVKDVTQGWNSLEDQRQKLQLTAQQHQQSFDELNQQNALSQFIRNDPEMAKAHNAMNGGTVTRDKNGRLAFSDGSDATNALSRYQSTVNQYSNMFKADNPQGDLKDGNNLLTGRGMGSGWGGKGPTIVNPNDQTVAPGGGGGNRPATKTVRFASPNSWNVSAPNQLDLNTRTQGDQITVSGGENPTYLSGLSDTNVPIIGINGPDGKISKYIGLNPKNPGEYAFLNAKGELLEDQTGVPQTGDADTYFENNQSLFSPTTLTIPLKYGQYRNSPIDRVRQAYLNSKNLMGRHGIHDYYNKNKAALSKDQNWINNSHKGLTTHNRGFNVE